MPTDEPPVTYEGDTILLDTKRMKVGHPYPVEWRGKLAVAILEPDGRVTVGRIIGLDELTAIV